MLPFQKVAEEAFKMNDPDFEICGPLIVSFVSDKAFPYLSFSEASVSLNIDPSETTEPTSSEQAIIFFSRYNFTFEVPIKADIVPCQVKKLSWDPAAMTINYELGSGSSDGTLPDLVQEPDCQLELTGKKLIPLGGQDFS